jgi:hypothetical protein
VTRLDSSEAADLTRVKPLTWLEWSRWLNSIRNWNDLTRDSTFEWLNSTLDSTCGWLVTTLLCKDIMEISHILTKPKHNPYSPPQKLLLAMITISIEIHFTTVYTWRVFEHERSRWAKERRRERALCLCNHSQLKPLRRREILTNLNIHIAKKVITLLEYTIAMICHLKFLSTF